MAREMKNSGIDWVGEIPDDWRIAPFRSFVIERAEKNKGEKTRELLALSYALGVTLYRDKVYNMDRVKDNYEDYQIVYENDLVLSPNDIIKGSVYVSKYYGCISPMYYVFSARNKNTHHLPYLSYLLRTKEAGRKYFMLARGLIGGISDSGKYITRRMTVSRQDLLSFKVPLPPFHIQQAIADFLDAKCAEIDGLLADLDAEVKTLAEYKKSIIAETVTHGLNPNVSLVPTDLGWIDRIPVHWGLEKAKYAFELRRTKGNIKNLELLSPTQKYGVIPQSQLEGVVLVNEKTNLETFRTIHAGDFCISLRSFQGGFEYSTYEGVVSPAYQVFYPTIKVCDGYFKYMFKSDGFISKINTFSMSLRDGKNIAFSDFGNMYIPIPPKEEQEAIAAYLDEKCAAIEQSIADKQTQIETLKAYKASLIYEYVTGKKQVI